MSKKLNISGLENNREISSGKKVYFYTIKVSKKFEQKIRKKNFGADMGQQSVVRFGKEMPQKFIFA